MFHPQHPKAWQSLQPSFQTTLRWFVPRVSGLRFSQQSKIYIFPPFYVHFFCKIVQSRASPTIGHSAENEEIRTKDIDDYLLCVQATFYAAVKKSQQLCGRELPRVI
jgi:hypothetical protein